MELNVAVLTEYRISVVCLVYCMRSDFGIKTGWVALWCHFVYNCGRVAWGSMKIVTCIKIRLLSRVRQAASLLQKEKLLYDTYVYWTVHHLDS